MPNNYSKIVSEIKYKAENGETLKILTPKQILQRLLIILAQVKACNASENLLNEITQIYILCIKKNELLRNYITLKYTQ